MTIASNSSDPTNGRVSSVTATIRAPAIPTMTTHLKTAASLILIGGLEDVNRDVDDDPHDVDEVPVDAWHLDAEVVLGFRAEVAAEGADRREREEHQADEDVGSVEAGEAVEDRAEGEVTGAEAEVHVLVDLDEEEGRSQQPGGHQAQFEAGAIAAADRLQGIVDREAGGDQDRGVHARHGLRQFEWFRRPARRVDDYPEEEVRGEEGPEEHHLGDDEEEDPEGLAVDPRALVGLRRTVVVIGVAVTDGYGCALHQL